MNITNLKLGQILVQSGALTEEHLQEALEKQKGTHKRLGEILLENGYISEMEMIRSLEQQMSIPYIDLSYVKIDETLSNVIPESFARGSMLVPVKRTGNLLTVAVADPLDYSAIDDISTYTKMKVYPMIAERSKIEAKIRALYTTQKANDAAKELADIKVVAAAAEHPENEEMSQPIIRFVNTMIEQAVIMKASDIHIEPQDEKLHIRFRIDGKLTPYMDTSSDLSAAVVSRIKYIGGMNIAEKRIPQDGRINYKIGNRNIDMRISVLPCVFGEKVVIRITTALGLVMDKKGIGFLPENLEKFDALLHNNHGIILLTGPTGSGKSTTLYTALKEVMRDDINVVTVENPVEMIIPNITQVEVNEKAGLTFASVLRSILRQDPDVVMVGEIRDRETAEIAMSVAITGHLVLSTLHTYDAASTVIRLVDMGIEPFMVSSAVIGVVAQRLVRTLCPNCKEMYQPDESELRMLGLDPSSDIRLYRAKEHGCPLCNGKGYSGRTAIHEIMPVTNTIKRLINTNASVDAIRAAALKEGMIPMDENLKRIVMEGRTSLNEIANLYAQTF
jgi:type IV pilus assembly protein PilB